MAISRLRDVEFKTERLKGGAVVSFDKSNQAVCRSCGAKIYFAVTEKNKKYIPIEETQDGEYQAHFATCKNADAHRGSAMNKIRESENNQDYLNNL